VNDPLRNRLCDLLGIEVPLIQAPIGSATSVALAAAVSRAGALGTLALSWREENEIRHMLRRMRGPYAVNFILEWDMHAKLAAALEEGARIVSLFWGDPTEYANPVHASGALLLQTVGSVDEARRALDAGADVLIAQGWEAGGHVRGETTTLALVPAVVDVAGEVPVVAAGGIADGRGLAAVLALGAAGAMIGTRFLAAEEANTHRRYRELLVAAAPDDAVYTTIFDEGWPNAPHRVLRNRTQRAWEQAGAPPRGSRPGEGEVIATRARRNLIRYADDIPTADTEGAVEELALYAGQSAGIVSAVEPAREIVRSISSEARAILARLGNGSRETK
jgi:NAD(P)H-dependent flavin oxidoreductase YrpB (nitropropane dioxygenase family)